MEETYFSIKKSIEHAKSYIRAQLRLKLYKAGTSLTKLITTLVLVITLLLTLPMLLTIAFIVLGFGFSEWFPTLGYTLSFLCSAAALILLILLCVGIVLLILRRPKAKLLNSILSIDDKIAKKKETSTYEEATDASIALERSNTSTLKPEERNDEN